MDLNDLESLVGEDVRVVDGDEITFEGYLVAVIPAPVLVLQDSTGKRTHVHGRVNVQRRVVTWEPL